MAHEVFIHMYLRIWYVFVVKSGTVKMCLERLTQASNDGRLYTDVVFVSRVTLTLPPKRVASRSISAGNISIIKH